MPPFLSRPWPPLRCRRLRTRFGDGRLSASFRPRLALCGDHRRRHEWYSRAGPDVPPSKTSDHNLDTRMRLLSFRILLCWGKPKPADYGMLCNMARALSRKNSLSFPRPLPTANFGNFVDQFFQMRLQMRTLGLATNAINTPILISAHGNKALTLPCKLGQLRFPCSAMHPWGRAESEANTPHVRGLSRPDSVDTKRRAVALLEHVST